MNANHKQSVTRNSESRLPPFTDQPKPQPLAKAEQVADQVAARIALVKQKQDLDLERILGKVAALNNAKPIIEATFGDPNHNLQQLTRVIIERGCDIAEDCIELVIEDGN